jgi:nicotinate-nucleotide adenylyltransferase
LLHGTNQLKMKIGLFFGSFNPVHVGHLIIGNFMATQTSLEQVWMVVSPQNPHKQKSSLARDYDRLHLVQLATEDNPKLQASNIEFGLPKPSYTVDTLAYLQENHPEKEFVLIMGSDNLGTFYKWKNYKKILDKHEIFVYQRPQYELGELANHPKVQLFEAPLMDISASYIRKSIQAGHSVEYLVSEPVLKSLESSNLYKK